MQRKGGKKRGIQTFQLLSFVALRKARRRKGKRGGRKEKYKGGRGEAEHVFLSLGLKKEEGEDWFVGVGKHCRAQETPVPSWKREDGDLSARLLY